jgi:FkbM family methyltransferase
MRTNLFRNIEGYLADRVSLKTYCKVVNSRNALRGKRHRIEPFSDDGVHKATDGKESIYLCRRGRHNRYKRGVMAGVDALARDYHLDAIAPFEGGTFIDCGANVGELGFWARARGMRYIAFEPEALEATCCDLNNFGGQSTTIRKALWNENTTLVFHSKPDSADSSLFEMAGSTDRIEVEAVALDSVIDIEDLPGPVIFKLEAEGAEPEVLQGAVNSLPRIDFVAVDSGYERGAEKKHTFVETANALQDHGFRLAQAQFRRITALYENTRR